MTRNPYSEPIQHFWDQLRAIKREPPWVPQVVQGVVLGALFLLAAVLYCTIGIVAQTSHILLELIRDARGRIRPESPIENSAYLLAIGLYFLLAMPLWLAQAPFLLVGWASNRSRFLGLVVAAAVALVAWDVIASREHGVIGQLVCKCQAFLRP